MKCSASKRLLTEILKQELGFEGFLISDYDAIDQITPDYKKADRDLDQRRHGHGDGAAKVPRVHHRPEELVAEGKVPMSRIDDAVTRILRVKFAIGLMDPNRSQLADRNLATAFGSAEHRAVARQAVRESLVLLKNEGKVLPLQEALTRIHVAGKNADDIGNQCGGWTIDWQGKSGERHPGRHHILAAIKKPVKPR